MLFATKIDFFVFGSKKKHQTKNVIFVIQENNSSKNENENSRNYVKFDTQI